MADESAEVLGVRSSPSLAAMSAADLVSYYGWEAWRVIRLGGTRLDDFRQQYVAEHATRRRTEDEIVSAGPKRPGESLLSMGRYIHTVWVWPMRTTNHCAFVSSLASLE
jgi:hypothetical protein